MNEHVWRRAVALYLRGLQLLPIISQMVMPRPQCNVTHTEGRGESKLVLIIGQKDGRQNETLLVN